MRILYFWCDKYLVLENNNCNLAGAIEFSYDKGHKKLIGISKNINSDGFFNLLDEQEKIPIEVSGIVGKNGIGKTTCLKIISELLCNRGELIDKDYKINYILVYEINNKKYISFEEDYVKQIMINNKEIFGKEIKEESEYIINSLSLNKSKDKLLEFPELDSIATLFISNSYEETCTNSNEVNNSFNLSNHFLLNKFFKEEDSIVGNLDLKKMKLEPLDFWKMEKFNFDIKLMCSSIYEKLLKEIELVSPKYFNIILDYALEEEKIFKSNSSIKRFNDSSVEKFSFELLMKTAKRVSFFDFVYERICDLTAELILAQKFIDEKKVIGLINGFEDYNECESILDLLNIIKNKLSENKDEYIIKMGKGIENGLLKKQNQSVYYNVEKIISAAASMIERLSKIIDLCGFANKEIEIVCKEIEQLNTTTIKHKKIPVLTKEICRTQNNKEIFKFISQLAEIQHEYFKITKVLPFYVESNGISSGQNAYVSIFAKLFEFFNMIKDKQEVKNIIILLDEIDIFLHPEWKKKLIYLLTKFLKMLFRKDKYKGIHIILTANEPYILSDIPKNNTILFDKYDYGEVHTKKYFQYKTLGANVIDLLDDSFFLSEGNKGDYISKAIEKIFMDLNNNEISRKKIEFYIKIAKSIEEPLIQRSLINKLNDKLDNDERKEMIEYYEQIIENLKNGAK